MATDIIKNRIKTEISVTKYLNRSQINLHHNYYDCFKCHQKNKIVVNPKTNMYRCFKCDRHFKDIFDLYQAKFQVNFSTAFQALIHQITIDSTTLIPTTVHTTTDLTKTRYQILTKSASYYHYLLTNYAPYHCSALAYLQNHRHLNMATINEFQLGFAPKPHPNYQFTSILTNYLIRERFAIPLIKGLNLVLTNPKPSQRHQLIDVFYDAIIIPKTVRLKSTIQVIGLKANPLKTITSTTPKYLEMKSNDLIKPKNYLYRLSEHLPFIQAQHQIIIYESEYDVMKSYQVGIKNVVAFGGKNFTDFQLSQLFKYIPHDYEILIVLDHDLSGVIKMHELYLKLIKKKYHRVKAIGIPNYKSADDFLNHHSAPALLTIFNNPQYYLTLNNY